MKYNVPKWSDFKNFAAFATKNFKVCLTILGYYKRVHVNFLSVGIAETSEENNNHRSGINSSEGKVTIRTGMNCCKNILFPRAICFSVRHFDVLITLKTQGWMEENNFLCDMLDLEYFKIILPKQQAKNKCDIYDAYLSPFWLILDNISSTLIYVLNHLDSRVKTQSNVFN